MKFCYVLICTAVLLNFCCFKTFAGMVNEKFRDECFQELKLNADEMELVKSNNLITKEMKTVPKSVQCYPFCYLKKSGVFDDKVELNEKLLTTLLNDAFKGDQNLIKAAIDKCKAGATATDGCEKAFTFEVCIRKQIM